MVPPSSTGGRTYARAGRATVADPKHGLGEGGGTDASSGRATRGANGGGRPGGADGGRRGTRTRRAGAHGGTMKLWWTSTVVTYGLVEIRQNYCLLFFKKKRDGRWGSFSGGSDPLRVDIRYGIIPRSLTPTVQQKINKKTNKRWITESSPSVNLQFTLLSIYNAFETHLAPTPTSTSWWKITSILDGQNMLCYSSNRKIAG
jgi:hypothetical protein